MIIIDEIGGVGSIQELHCVIRARAKVSGDGCNTHPLSCNTELLPLVRSVSGPVVQRSQWTYSEYEN